MPFLLDYTPSGGHILFQNILADKCTDAVREIGYLEDDMRSSCERIIPGNLRRKNGVSINAASVFSGLGRLAEYISLITMEAFKDNKIPVTVSDTYDHCMNLDNSWAEGSPHARCIRAPFGLHKKNQEKYEKWDQQCLVDVIGGFYDGKSMQGDACNK